MENAENNISNLQAVRGALDEGSIRRMQRALKGLHPSEVARVLESLPVRERKFVWDLIEPDIEGDILVDVADDVRTGLIERMDEEELVAATEGMQLDDLADLIIDLPETVTQQVLTTLGEADRERLQKVMSYDEDSAGGLMNPDTISVRPDVSLEVVIRYLRVSKSMSDGTDSIFVVDREDRYLGVLLLSRLLTSDPELSVRDVMDAKALAIHVDTRDEEITRLFENRDLLSAAVVDAEDRLIGRITVDDVVDVIREEAEHSIMSAAGLDEENDMFAPVIVSARRRAIWLGVNLLTAFLAAAVVDTFQGAIDKIVLLAVLMPIVPSMGGVAGTQSLTIITRAMALGQVDRTNAMTIFRKEVSVGLINGMAWAMVVACITMLWFGTPIIGAVVAVALMINMIIAAVAGFTLPLLLKRLRIDPAIAGGVVLTTITDVVGYGAFLGLGAMILL
ncbi:MAG: magnesium transporter [Pseudomonadota bacterium]